MLKHKSRSDEARRIARLHARRAFQGRPDKECLQSDAESVAWELEASAKPDVSAASIAFIAVRRVKVGRQHRESIRSLSTGRVDKRSKRPKISQVRLDLQEVALTTAAPSETVPFWMDFTVWLSALDKRRRAICEYLATGETGKETAQEFGVSDGRISQIRREFQRSWNEFQGAPV